MLILVHASSPSHLWLIANAVPFCSYVCVDKIVQLLKRNMCTAIASHSEKKTPTTARNKHNFSQLSDDVVRNECCMSSWCFASCAIDEHREIVHTQQMHRAPQPQMMPLKCMNESGRISKECFLFWMIRLNHWNWQLSIRTVFFCISLMNLDIFKKISYDSNHHLVAKESEKRENKIEISGMSFEINLSCVCYHSNGETRIGNWLCCQQWLAWKLCDDHRLIKDGMVLLVMISFGIAQAAIAMFMGWF